jgi:hypothetical protein
LGGTPLVPCRLLRVLRQQGAAYEGEARSPRAVDRLIALASKALDELQGLIYTPRSVELHQEDSNAERSQI